MSRLVAELSDWLSGQHDRNLYRRRRVLQTAQSARVEVDGNTLINFSSNDYLGLAAEPVLVDALVTGARRWGVGSGSAHLVAGHSDAHHQLEKELAEFVGRPRALLFSSGYTANLAVISALAGRHDVVLQDRLNHASLLDGVKLAGARLKRFAHADAGDALRLAGNEQRLKMIATDTVFSMDGDQAPVHELCELGASRDVWLLFDEAHALGVIGKQGRGLLDELSIAHADNIILMGTLGKSFGCSGAFVAGSEAVIETLIQRARSYIYTTACSPAMAEATRAALRLVVEADERRAHLAELVAYFRRGVAQTGLMLMPSTSAIQPIIAGSAERARRWSNVLQTSGHLVLPIRPPTVPEGTARLRVTLTAAHGFADIDSLLDALAQLDHDAGVQR